MAPDITPHPVSIDSPTAPDSPTVRLRANRPAPSPQPPAADIPDRIGPFRILDKLGEGGMGSVFLAEQTEPVKRRVALKIMRSPLGGRDGEIRFEAERQALARFHHPNVAQIFEAGSTPEGHPYFAMELVGDEKITTYCDSRKLSIRQRLRLFRDVCAGVQHAHQKGIIHRDLKPSNILVMEIEGRPVPKIIDFGIAKAVDQPLGDAACVTGDRLIGTPAYLSPEAVQIGENGPDVDTRSDVYSLGVLLYELLVGQRPFDDRSINMLQVLQRIVVAEPTQPSRKWSELDVSTRRAVAEQRKIQPIALPGSLRGDLDWIVLKAIARDRQDRYGSAAELSDDIARHLRHEAVTASPPSSLYRVRKFVRRRLGLVAAAALIMLALAAGFIARTLEAERANREAAAAVAAREEAELALKKAEQARRETEEVTNFLGGLFKVSAPGEALGNTITARQLLDDASEKIQDSFADQPLARARFMLTIGEIYRRLGLYKKAEQLLKGAVEIHRRSLPEDDLTLAMSLNSLANLHALLGRPQEAKPLFERALAIRQRHLEPDSLNIVMCLNNLGNIYADQGELERAESLYVRAVDMVSKHQDGQANPDLFVAFNNLASLYADQDRHQEAVPLFERFLDYQRTFHGPNHPHVATALGNLAYSRAQLGAVAEAEKLYFEARDILLKVFGPQHPDIAYWLTLLADLYVEQQRYGEAEALYRRAVAIQEVALPEDHPERRGTAEGLRKLLSHLKHPA